MKGDLSEKIQGNVIISVYSVNMVFFFHTNILPFCQKSKYDLLPKKHTLKDGISSFIEKDDIYPRKYGISSDRKINDYKKRLRF